MKLKRYQSFLESKQDIDSICREYYINNYTINDDGTIDVDGNVHLSGRGLTKLTLKFRNVSGDFYCYDNKLTTLEGCPQSVVGSFYCSNNQLTTLEGSPRSVGGSFFCYNNKLTTLEESPSSVGGSFDCSNNKIKDFRGFPEIVDGGVFFVGSPVNDILKQFDKDLWKKAIYWINEYDVIDDKGNVIEDRLEDVKEQLD
jgi:hypothetical protein